MVVKRSGGGIFKMQNWELAVPFGVDANGARVFVNDVPRGRACGAFCPACGAQLLARQGDVMSWHFAHVGQGGGGCGEGLWHREIKSLVFDMTRDGGGPLLKFGMDWETTDEALAAEGLRDGGAFYLYAYAQEFAVPGVNRRVDLLLGFQFDEPIGGFAPPLHLEGIRGWEEQIAVEVAVTNAKDDAYVADMRRAGLPAYEMGFSASELHRTVYRQMAEGSRFGDALSSVIYATPLRRLWPTAKEVVGLPRIMWPVAGRWRLTECEGGIDNRCVHPTDRFWRRLDQRWCDHCEDFRQKAMALLKRHGREVAEWLDVYGPDPDAAW